MTSALARLIEGTLPVDDWVALVRAKQPPPASFRRPEHLVGASAGLVRAEVPRSVTRLGEAMKADIHPEYVPSHVRCTCGNEFWTRSTKPELHVEICSNCHPFYTGRQKLVDTGGRVERFRRRAARSGAASRGERRAATLRARASVLTTHAPRAPDIRILPPPPSWRRRQPRLSAPPASVKLVKCSVEEHEAAFHAPHAAGARAPTG